MPSPPILTLLAGALAAALLAALVGNVEIAFKSDYFPLERFA
jgi:hypothetical protein